MNKAKNTPVGWSEDRLQQEAFIWFTNTFPNLRGLLFSVPNGLLVRDENGDKNWAMIKRFKMTGMVSGVSDMIFLFGGVCYLFETKRPDGGGGQSKDQKKWQEIVESQGFSYFLWNDLLEFKNIILNIVNSNPQN